MTTKLFSRRTWVSNVPCFWATFTLTIGGALGLPVCPVLGRPTDGVSGTQRSSLDDQLLESLDDQPPPATAVKPKDEPSLPAVEHLEPNRLPVPPHGLRETDEPGPPGASDPLVRIGQGMRLAQMRIAGEDTSRATQTLQQQVVDDLMQLILQMQKKCNGQKQCQSPVQRSSTSPKPKPSRHPARDSVTRLDQQSATQPNPAAVRQLNRRMWGELPATLRQPVLNADFEQFLPKYEKLIEQYFRRLAEETGAQP